MTEVIPTVAIPLRNRHRKFLGVDKPSFLFVLSIWVALELINAQFIRADVSSDEIMQRVAPSIASDRFSNVPSPAILEVRFGHSGIWKLGYPTQSLVTVAAGEVALNGTLEVESVDADGVGVIYQTSCQMDAKSTKTLSIMTQHGRAARAMHVRLLDAGGKHLVERLVSDDERGIVLPVGQPWVVGIGSEMGLDQAALKSAKGLLPSYSTCEVAEVNKLPVIPNGYRGIDLLVISTHDWTILQGISTEQQDAILEWVQGGGHVLVWVGENGERLRELPWLTTLVRADVQGVAKKVDPILLESFLSSQKRLEPLTCCRLAPQNCLIDLSLQSVDRQKLPFIYRSALGFGQVHVCAADLNTSPLRDWTERKLLLERLYSEHFEMLRETHSATLDRASYLGYLDLSGQIHAALDLFENVRVGSLSLIAIVLLGIVLLLGPFDYFVVSKAWKRPAWTWISLAFWSATALLGTTSLARVWKPRELAANSIELIDVDCATSRIRGQSLTHVYSGQAGRFDFSAIATSVFPALTTEENESSTANRQGKRAELSWSGQPGYGLGGFDSDVRTDIGFPTYGVLHCESDKAPLHRHEQPGCTAEMLQVGINFAGSKSMRFEWSESIELASDSWQFSSSGATEFLQGSWTNPMEYDLLDGWLLYRGWLYPLQSRIPPNEKAKILSSTTPKDLGRRLQRRQVLQDRDSSLPWDPTDRKDFGRLVEMLAFYQAGGGRGYTGLSHSYWNELDLSKHLKMNRVIVFGRLAKPVVKWRAKAASQTIDIRDANRVAYVRFVIPVTFAN